ncbi:MAG: sigma-70 family RNA polymerase sigma factor [Planctomycetota bacterium]
MSENPPGNQDHGVPGRDHRSDDVDDSARMAAGVGDLMAAFAECRAGLRSFLSGKLPQPADVEDCLQSVQVALLKNQTTIPHAAMRAWLFRVAANEAALFWRRRAVVQRATERVAVDRETDSYDLNTPENASERSETRLRVIDAIETLPPESKEIIQMRIHEDLTFQQIADRLDQPLGTVLSRMRRAAGKLRHLLADESPSEKKSDNKS